MSDISKPTFPTQPYKGTRDFYPEDLRKKSYIFEKWRAFLLQNGYVEYETSLLENAELYIAKSGQELGGSQLYNFHDKGDRFVALRPEQTPSLARIVAHKYGDLRLPLRWFSIPNCFRYERPQKGRLREHWQLNVDIIGLEAGPADMEILNIVGGIFKAFGATKDNFKILFNHRQVLDIWLENHDLKALKASVYKVLDDWFKLTLEENTAQLTEAGLDQNQIQNIVGLTQKQGENWEEYLEIARTFPEIDMILETLSVIQPDVEYEFNPCIIRGIAYYTGLVIEAFDKNRDNPRALFGGGRYDNLLDLFGQKAPGVGFGWGDVTMSEFLTNWNLWPDFLADQTRVGIMPNTEANLVEIYTKIIPQLKTLGKIYEIDYDFTRGENKRFETLKKRGCAEIIKLGFELK